jgi:tetratricopeptide (TPR) repeat protein
VIRKLLIVVVPALIVATIGGVAARLWAAHRFRTELDQARKEMEGGLVSLARKRLVLLANEQPRHTEVAYELGRCEAVRGNPEQAVELWARIDPLSTWGPPAALEFAQAAIPLGRISQVERILRSALERPSSQSPALWHLLLTILGQQGRDDEARRLIQSRWRQLESAGPDHLAERLTLLHDHIGLDLEPFPLEWNQSLLEQGKPSSAEDQRALALARAHLATRSGDFERAEEILHLCRRRWPADLAVWNACLRWAVAAGRVDRALEALERLPARLEREGRIMELRAWLALKRNDRHGEARALEELVALEPGREPVLARLAELAQQAGDAAGAAALRRRKAELDRALDRYFPLYKYKQLADHLGEMALLAERLGRFFEARAFWELVSLGDPSNKDAGPALARLAGNGTTFTRHEGTLAQLLAADIGPLSPPGHNPRAADRQSALHQRQSARWRTGAIPHFVDAASAAGLAEFVQDNGVSDRHQLPEMASGGVGLLDFDRDGFLDVYCVQGGRFPPPADAAASYAGDRLYRNRGDGTFVDVTQQSGIAAMQRGYGHGVAVADYDNDGCPDLFVTRFGSHALYHNRGDGTFEDVTEHAGLGGDRDWPTSAAFADLDGDGDLDLYVCHYGAWDTQNPRICKDPSGAIVIACDPRVIEAKSDHLFRNDAGRFADVTAQSGINDQDGRGLGVVAADLDGDGRIDIFVANDGTANYLFLNRGGFRFDEVGQESGVAANAEGGYQAGMGVACGDYDGDGLPDLAVTNFYGQSTTFFQNLGHGLFADHTSAIGLAAPSRHRLGFGAAFLDANNDGWLDLLTANGFVSDQRPLFPYAMNAQVFLGGSAGVLRDITADAGPPFQRPFVGRGLAVGDIDNDGRLDALMIAQNEPLVEFQNVTGAGRGRFAALRLEGSTSNPDAIGAVVRLSSGGRTQVAERFGGGSYQSAGDPRLHFGLGGNARVEALEVRWPSGKIDRYQDLGSDQEYLLREADPCNPQLPMKDRAASPKSDRTVGSD